jgi:hypothetical protein
MELWIREQENIGVMKLGSKEARNQGAREQIIAVILF